VNIKKLYNKSFTSSRYSVVTTNVDMKLAYNMAINDCMELFNKDKIRVLKRICHTMKCYKEMSGDCRQCQIQKELKRIKEGR